MAVRIHRQGNVVMAIPSLASPGEQVFAAILDPLHRPAPGLAGKQATDIAAPGSPLAAKASAVGVGDDIHLIRGQTKTRGPAQAEHARGLNAAMDRQIEFHGIPLGNATEGLGGVRAQAIPTKFLVEDMGRSGESPIDVAPGEDPLHHHVAVLIIQDPGAVGLHGDEGVRHRIQGFVVHLDQFGGVLRHPPAARRHRGHGLAHVVDLLPRDAMYSPAIGGGLRGKAPALGILARHHRHYALQGFRSARIHPRDPRMGEGAAENRAMKHPRKDDIVDELHSSREQSGVLDPANASAHETRLTRREFRQVFRDFNRHGFPPAMPSLLPLDPPRAPPIQPPMIRQRPSSRRRYAPHA